MNEDAVQDGGEEYVVDSPDDSERPQRYEEPRLVQRVQVPRDSPMRAVPKSANSTHIAMATNNGPILGKRTGDLPTSFATKIVTACASHRVQARCRGGLLQIYIYCGKLLTGFHD